MTSDKLARLSIARLLRDFTSGNFCLRGRLATRRPATARRRNHARELARLQVRRRNRPAQPQAILAAQQGDAPLSRLYLPPLYTLR